MCVCVCVCVCVCEKYRILFSLAILLFLGFLFVNAEVFFVHICFLWSGLILQDTLRFFQANPSTKKDHPYATSSGIHRVKVSAFQYTPPNSGTFSYTHKHMHTPTSNLCGFVCLSVCLPVCLFLPVCPSLFLSLSIYIRLADWDYRICRLHLCRRVRPSPINECPGYDTNLLLMLRLFLKLWGT